MAAPSNMKILIARGKHVRTVMSRLPLMRPSTRSHVDGDEADTFTDAADTFTDRCTVWPSGASQNNNNRSQRDNSVEGRRQTQIGAKAHLPGQSVWNNGGKGRTPDAYCLLGIGQPARMEDAALPRRKRPAL